MAKKVKKDLAPEAARDEALFEALGKNKKKRRRRIFFTVICIVLILGIVAVAGVSYLQRQVREQFAANQGEVLAYEVTTGSISTVVSGSGSFPGGQMPDGENWGSGQMPSFGGSFSGFGGMTEDLETTDIDIGNAHISVEIDGGKESGDLDSLAPGSTVTITLNGKGQATYVLVSSRSYFGGRGSN